MKNYFLLKALDWAVRRSKGFSYSDLMSSSNFAEWERSVLTWYFENAAKNSQRRNSPNLVQIPETVFYVIHHGGSNFKDDHFQYVLTSDAFFKLIDYEELKEARKNAKNAFWFSITAIIIASITLIITIFK